MTTIAVRAPFMTGLVVRLSSIRRHVLAGALVIAVAGPAVAQTAENTAPVAVPGPVAILEESARDFLGLASPDSLTVLAMGAGGALAFHSVDSDVNWQIGGAGYQFLGPGEWLGHAAVQTGIAVTTYLAGRTVGDRRTAMIGQQLIRAQLVTQFSTLAIKAAASRQRPDGSNNRSFPSGHASMSFATATILSGNFGWRVSVPAYAIATYVATSRLHENRHYMSDVVFGSALGIAAARVTLRRDRQAGALVQPVLMSGGAGVVVTW